MEQPGRARQTRASPACQASSWCLGKCCTSQRREENGRGSQQSASRQLGASSQPAGDAWVALLPAIEQDGGEERERRRGAGDRAK